MQIEAEAIVNYARQNGLKMVRGGVGEYNNYCARAVIKHALGFHKPFHADGLSMYDPKVHEAAGLTREQMDALEEGFDYAHQPDDEITKGKYAMEYYRMRQRIAELAGL